jgi:glycosyltransferase involved in cell wall biosynthesis
VEAYARLETRGRATTLILNGNWPRSGETGAQPPPRRRMVGVLRQAAHVLRRHGLTGFCAQAAGAAKRMRTERDIRRWIARANSQDGKQVLCTDLPRPELVQAYMAANLFVFASAVEYSPLVLFEAAAAGTPFLSTPVGNAEEIASWTAGGVICPADKDAQGFTRVDPAVLAGEMRRCLDNSDLLVRLGASGRQSWRREFTWQAIAPRYEAILAGGFRAEVPIPAVGGND